MATMERDETVSDVTQTTQTVLFVDDEPELLEMYDLLCRTDYTVLTADSGEAALEQFGDHVDIAFFDRRMPRMSGGEVIETIRDAGYQTPLGVISAVEPDTGPEIDADVYLTKPVSRDSLFETIEEQTD